MIYHLSLSKKQSTKQGHQALCCVHMYEFYQYETTSVLDTKGLILLLMSAQNIKNNVESRSRMATRTRRRNVDSLFSDSSEELFKYPILVARTKGELVPKICNKQFNAFFASLNTAKQP